MANCECHNQMINGLIWITIPQGLGIQLLTPWPQIPLVIAPRSALVTLRQTFI